jgi:hypothetical protein
MTCADAKQAVRAAALKAGFNTSQADALTAAIEQWLAAYLPIAWRASRRPSPAH